MKHFKLYALISSRVGDLLKKCIPYKARYPRIIKQKRIWAQGFLFEVTNSIEEWRVRSLDDEEEFLSLLLKELKDDDIFFDIGACVGLFAIHASKKCEKVFAFEPDLSFRQRIRRNIKINGMRNIVVVPWAVCDVNEEVNLYTGGIKGRSPSIRDFGQGQSVSIEAHSLDEIIHAGKLPFPSVIKMDIEGAEILALRGMEKVLLSNHRPRAIFIETHPVLLQDYGALENDVFEKICHWGYELVFQSLRDEQRHSVFKLIELDEYK